MTQQTIKGTVYRVGQIVTLRRLLEMPVGTEVKRQDAPKGINDGIDLPAFVITALPNPDPVAEDWREVHMVPKGRHWNGENMYSVRTEFQSLQLAMQEVCKADEVKLEGLDDYHLDHYVFEKGNGYTETEIDCIIRCFLLGGRVFVKGGV